jgi:hypothetical protein
MTTTTRSRRFAGPLLLLALLGAVAWSASAAGVAGPAGGEALAVQRPAAARAMGVCPPFPLRDEAGNPIDPVQGVNATAPYSPRQTCGTTGCLQATCVDATVIPHLEKRLNYSLGCCGCREATDLAPSETVLGFPGERLELLAAALGRLAERAVPRSRTKSAFNGLDLDASLARTPVATPAARG